MKRSIALGLLLLLLTGCSVQEPAPSAPTTEPVQTPASSLQLGRLAPELTVTTADGERWQLSQILEEKELVMLNFWFEDCPWCMREFPVMDMAYSRYAADVEILALDPVDGADAVGSFAQESGLTFPMASCPRSWAVESGITGYPTSVFIDRDGMVCLIHAGAITDPSILYAIFDTFTAGDYRTTVYHSLSQIIE